MTLDRHGAVSHCIVRGLSAQGLQKSRKTLNGRAGAQGVSQAIDTCALWRAVRSRGGELRTRGELDGQCMGADRTRRVAARTQAGMAIAPATAPGARGTHSAHSFPTVPRSRVPNVAGELPYMGRPTDRKAKNTRESAEDAARAAPASRGSNKPTSHGLPRSSSACTYSPSPPRPTLPAPACPALFLPRPCRLLTPLFLPSTLVCPSPSFSPTYSAHARSNFSSPPVRPRQPVRLHPHRMDLYPLHRSFLHNRTYVPNTEFPGPPAHIRF